MANKQTGGTRRTGIDPLAYMGVEPSSPPQLVRYQQEPTTRDFSFNIGDLWLVESPFEIWMLVDKPQNVANWVLIYPQGGAAGISVIHTPAGDADALAGVIDFDDGENTNVEATGAHSIAYNLNRFIQWPATNNAGTEGVIYLGTGHFMHDYSGAAAELGFNTFLGHNAGNFSNTAENNTGLGAAAFAGLTTGNANTAVGSDALTNLTSGDDNIAIGPSSGTAYSTESDNIVINNLGVGADAGVIRIGTAAIQFKNYQAGITGITIANPTSKSFVVVGTDGQLGQATFTSTGGTITITQPSAGTINLEEGGGNFSQPFLGIQQANVINATGNGTVYQLGSGSPMVEQYDVGGNFNPGDGAGTPASFTAPATGIYSFTVASMSSVGRLSVGITTPSLNYNMADNTQTPEKTFSASLTIGDVVHFFAVGFGQGADNVSLLYLTPANGSQVATVNGTFISGYRIA